MATVRTFITLICALFLICSSPSFSAGCEILKQVGRNKSKAESNYYKLIKLTPDQRKLGKSVLKKWEKQLEKYPTRNISIDEPGDVWALQSLIESSELPTHKKISAIERTKQFAERKGVISFQPKESAFFQGRDSDRHLYHPIINLRSINDVGSFTWVHELSHFADQEHIIGELMTRGDMTEEEALGRYSALNVNGSPTFIKWTEENALKAEGDQLSSDYPQLEALRRYSFISNAAVKGTTENDEVTKLLKNLSDISISRKLRRLTRFDKETLSLLSPIQREYQIKAWGDRSAWSFSTPETHWKTEQQHWWLSKIKKIYNEDLKKYREASFERLSKSRLRELGLSIVDNPSATDLLKGTIDWYRSKLLKSKTRDGSEDYYLMTEVRTLAEQINYKDSERIKALENSQGESLSEYEKRVTTLVNELFPEAGDAELRERVVPIILRMGILESPDYITQVGTSKHSVKAFLERIKPRGVAPSQVPQEWSQVLERLKTNPEMKNYLANFANPTDKFLLQVLQQHGYSIKEPLQAMLTQTLPGGADKQMEVLRFIFSLPDGLAIARGPVEVYFDNISKQKRNSLLDALENASNSAKKPAERNLLDGWVLDLRARMVLESGG